MLLGTSVYIAVDISNLYTISLTYVFNNAMSPSSSAVYKPQLGTLMLSTPPTHLVFLSPRHHPALPFAGHSLSGRALLNYVVLINAPRVADVDDVTMKINITSDDGGVFMLDVSESFSVGELKEILEVEFETPRGEMALVHNMMTMADHQPLSAYNLQEGDVVIMTRMQVAPPHQQQQPQQQQQSSGGGAVEGLPFIDWSSIRLPQDTAGAGSSNAPATQVARPPVDEREEIRQYFLNTPHELAILKERNAPLAEALVSGDKERFYKVLEEQQRLRREKEAERIRMLNANPLDPRYQQKIAEDIRHTNVQDNMESAIEHIPEMFGQVIMLYIKCTVNGCPVLAFVDSGAQSTIMSQECAERCNIMRLVDQRWAGTAVGVGTQEIVGRVHLCQIQIEGVFLPSSFSILKKQPMDMLLGLDMLKRHQVSLVVVQLESISLLLLCHVRSAVLI